VLKIGDIYVSPVLTWASVVDKTYVVQRQQIGATNWVNVGTFTATSNLSLFTDTSVTSTNSWIYRLQVQTP
jgi:hypothetical protein